jgi:hypothetical protein
MMFDLRCGLNGEIIGSINVNEEDLGAAAWAHARRLFSERFGGNVIIFLMAEVDTIVGVAMQIHPLAAIMHTEEARMRRIYLWRRQRFRISGKNVHPETIIIRPRNNRRDFTGPERLLDNMCIFQLVSKRRSELRRSVPYYFLWNENGEEHDEFPFSVTMLI